MPVANGEANKKRSRSCHVHEVAESVPRKIVKAADIATVISRERLSLYLRQKKRACLLKSSAGSCMRAEQKTSQKTELCDCLLDLSDSTSSSDVAGRAASSLLPVKSDPTSRVTVYPWTRFHVYTKQKATIMSHAGRKKRYQAGKSQEELLSELNDNLVRRYSAVTIRQYSKDPTEKTPPDRKTSQSKQNTAGHADSKSKPRKIVLNRRNQVSVPHIDLRNAQKSGRRNKKTPSQLSSANSYGKRSMRKGKAINPKSADLASSSNHVAPTRNVTVSRRILLRSGKNGSSDVPSKPSDVTQNTAESAPSKTAVKNRSRRRRDLKRRDKTKDIVVHENEHDREKLPELPDTMPDVDNKLSDTLDDMDCSKCTRCDSCSHGAVGVGIKEADLDGVEILKASVVKDETLAPKLQRSNEILELHDTVSSSQVEGHALDVDSGTSNAEIKAPDIVLPRKKDETPAGLPDTSITLRNMRGNSDLKNDDPTEQVNSDRTSEITKPYTQATVNEQMCETLTENIGALEACTGQQQDETIDDCCPRIPDRAQSPAPSVDCHKTANSSFNGVPETSDLTESVIDANLSFEDRHSLSSTNIDMPASLCGEQIALDTENHVIDRGMTESDDVISGNIEGKISEVSAIPDTQANADTITTDFDNPEAEYNKNSESDFDVTSPDKQLANDTQSVKKDIKDTAECQHDAAETTAGKPIPDGNDLKLESDKFDGDNKTTDSTQPVENATCPGIVSNDLELELDKFDGGKITDSTPPVDNSTCPGIVSNDLGLELDKSDGGKITDSTPPVENATCPGIVSNDLELELDKFDGGKITDSTPPVDNSTCPGIVSNDLELELDKFDGGKITDSTPPVENAACPGIVSNDLELESDIFGGDAKILDSTLKLESDKYGDIKTPTDSRSVDNTKSPDEVHSQIDDDVKFNTECCDTLELSLAGLDSAALLCDEESKPGNKNSGSETPAREVERPLQASTPEHWYLDDDDTLPYIVRPSSDPSDEETFDVGNEIMRLVEDTESNVPSVDTLVQVSGDAVEQYSNTLDPGIDKFVASHSLEQNLVINEAVKSSLSNSIISTKVVAEKSHNSDSDSDGIEPTRSATDKDSVAVMEPIFTDTVYEVVSVGKDMELCEALITSLTQVCGEEELGSTQDCIVDECGTVDSFHQDMRPNESKQSIPSNRNILAAVTVEESESAAENSISDIYEVEPTISATDKDTVDVLKPTIASESNRSDWNPETPANVIQFEGAEENSCTDYDKLEKAQSAEDKCNVADAETIIADDDEIKHLDKDMGLSVPTLASSLEPLCGDGLQTTTENSEVNQDGTARSFHQDMRPNESTESSPSNRNILAAVTVKESESAAEKSISDIDEAEPTRSASDKDTVHVIEPVIASETSPSDWSAATHASVEKFESVEENSCSDNDKVEKAQSAEDKCNAADAETFIADEDEIKHLDEAMGLSVPTLASLELLCSDGQQTTTENTEVDQDGNVNSLKRGTCLDVGVQSGPADSNNPIATNIKEPDNTTGMLISDNDTCGKTAANDSEGEALHTISDHDEHLDKNTEPCVPSVTSLTLSCDQVPQGNTQNSDVDNQKDRESESEQNDSVNKGVESGLSNLNTLSVEDVEQSENTVNNLDVNKGIVDVTQSVAGKDGSDNDEPIISGGAEISNADEFQDFNLNCQKDCEVNNIENEQNSNVPKDECVVGNSNCALGNGVCDVVNKSVEADKNDFCKGQSDAKHNAPVTSTETDDKSASGFECDLPVSDVCVGLSAICANYGSDESQTSGSDVMSDSGTIDCRASPNEWPQTDQKTSDGVNGVVEIVEGESGRLEICEQAVELPISVEACTSVTIKASSYVGKSETSDAECCPSDVEENSAPTGNVDLSIEQLTPLNALEGTRNLLPADVKCTTKIETFKSEQSIEEGFEIDAAGISQDTEQNVSLTACKGLADEDELERLHVEGLASSNTGCNLAANLDRVTEDKERESAVECHESNAGLESCINSDDTVMEEDRIQIVTEPVEVEDCIRDRHDSSDGQIGRPEICKEAVESISIKACPSDMIKASSNVGKSETSDAECRPSDVEENRAQTGDVDDSIEQLEPQNVSGVTRNSLTADVEVTNEGLLKLCDSVENKDPEKTVALSDILINADDIINGDCINKNTDITINLAGNDHCFQEDSVFKIFINENNGETTGASEVVNEEAPLQNACEEIPAESAVEITKFKDLDVDVNPSDVTENLAGANKGFEGNLNLEVCNNDIHVTVDASVVVYKDDAIPPECAVEIVETRDSNVDVLFGAAEDTVALSEGDEEAGDQYIPEHVTKETPISDSVKDYTDDTKDNISSTNDTHAKKNESRLSSVCPEASMPDCIFAGLDRMETNVNLGLEMGPKSEDVAVLVHSGATVEEIAIGGSEKDMAIASSVASKPVIADEFSQQLCDAGVQIAESGCSHEDFSLPHKDRPEEGMHHEPPTDEVSASALDTIKLDQGIPEFTDISREFDTNSGVVHKRCILGNVLEDPCNADRAADIETVELEQSIEEGSEIGAVGISQGTEENVTLTSCIGLADEDKLDILQDEGLASSNTGCDLAPNPDRVTENEEKESDDTVTEEDQSHIATELVEVEECIRDRHDSSVELEISDDSEGGSVMVNSNEPLQNSCLEDPVTDLKIKTEGVERADDSNLDPNISDHSEDCPELVDSNKTSPNMDLEMPITDIVPADECSTTCDGLKSYPELSDDSDHSKMPMDTESSLTPFALNMKKTDISAAVPVDRNKPPQSSAVETPIVDNAVTEDEFVQQRQLEYTAEQELLDNSKGSIVLTGGGISPRDIAAEKPATDNTMARNDMARAADCSYAYIDGEEKMSKEVTTDALASFDEFDESTQGKMNVNPEPIEKSCDQLSMVNNDEVLNPETTPGSICLEMSNSFVMNAVATILVEGDSAGATHGVFDEDILPSIDFSSADEIMQIKENSSPVDTNSELSQTEEKRPVIIAEIHHSDDVEESFESDAIDERNSSERKPDDGSEIRTNEAENFQSTSASGVIRTRRLSVLLNKYDACQVPASCTQNKEKRRSDNSSLESQSPCPVTKDLPITTTSSSSSSKNSGLDDFPAIIHPNDCECSSCKTSLNDGYYEISEVTCDTFGNNATSPPVDTSHSEIDDTLPLDDVNSVREPTLQLKDIKSSKHIVISEKSFSWNSRGCSQGDVEHVALDKLENLKDCNRDKRTKSPLPKGTRSKDSSRDKREKNSHPRGKNFKDCSRDKGENSSLSKVVNSKDRQCDKGGNSSHSNGVNLKDSNRNKGEKASLLKVTYSKNFDKRRNSLHSKLAKLKDCHRAKGEKTSLPKVTEILLSKVTNSNDCDKGEKSSISKVTNSKDCDKRENSSHSKGANLKDCNRDKGEKTSLAKVTSSKDCDKREKGSFPKTASDCDKRENSSHSKGAKLKDCNRDKGEKTSLAKATNAKDCDKRENSVVPKVTKSKDSDERDKISIPKVTKSKDSDKRDRIFIPKVIPKVTKSKDSDKRDKISIPKVTNSKDYTARENNCLPKATKSKDSYKRDKISIPEVTNLKDCGNADKISLPKVTNLKDFTASENKPLPDAVEAKDCNRDNVEQSPLPVSTISKGCDDVFINIPDDMLKEATAYVQTIIESTFSNVQKKKRRTAGNGRRKRMNSESSSVKLPGPAQSKDDMLKAPKPRPRKRLSSTCSVDAIRKRPRHRKSVDVYTRPTHSNCSDSESIQSDFVVWQSPFSKADDIASTKTVKSTCTMTYTTQNSCFTSNSVTDTVTMAETSDSGHSTATVTTLSIPGANITVLSTQSAVANKESANRSEPIVKSKHFESDAKLQRESVLNLTRIEHDATIPPISSNFSVKLVKSPCKDTVPKPMSIPTPIFSQNATVTPDRKSEGAPECIAIPEIPENTETLTNSPVLCSKAKATFFNSKFVLPSKDGAVTEKPLSQLEPLMGLSELHSCAPTSPTLRVSPTHSRNAMSAPVSETEPLSAQRTSALVPLPAVKNRVERSKSLPAISLSQTSFVNHGSQFVSSAMSNLGRPQNNNAGNVNNRKSVGSRFHRPWETKSTGDVEDVKLSSDTFNTKQPIQGCGSDNGDEVMPCSCHSDPGNLSLCHDFSGDDASSVQSQLHGDSGKVPVTNSVSSDMGKTVGKDLTQLEDGQDQSRKETFTKPADPIRASKGKKRAKKSDSADDRQKSKDSKKAKRIDQRTKSRRQGTAKKPPHSKSKSRSMLGAITCAGHERTEDAAKKPSKPDLPYSVLECKDRRFVLKRTGKSFVQDAPCFEIAKMYGVETSGPSYGSFSWRKCRECRSIKRRDNGVVFCRFYGFRKLKFEDKLLCTAGFLLTEDCAAKDLRLWLPQESCFNGEAVEDKNVLSPNDPFKCDVADFILTNIGRRFCEIVRIEKRAMSWIGENEDIFWKKPVPGVRDLCDVCETTLFNIHWICQKCGYGVCLDCYERRMGKSGKEQVEYDADKQHNFRWDRCVKGQIHIHSNMVPTQIIPSTCLYDVNEKMHRICKDRGIKTSCRCQNAEKRRAARQKNSRKRKYPFAATAIPEKRLRDSVCTNLADSESPARYSSISPKSNSKTVDPNCSRPKEDGVNGDISSADPCLEGAKLQWLCGGRLLQLTDSQHAANLRVFKRYWKEGMPVVVSGVGKYLNMDLWYPERLSSVYGEEESKNSLINCLNGSIVTNMRIRDFWDGFENISHRLCDLDNKTMILKLKDWPPTEAFHDVMPEMFEDLMSALPLPEYTYIGGRCNLASRLPQFFVKPDLGPKMYNAYGWVTETNWQQGTTNLHLDISDAVNVMVYVGIPHDEPPEAKDRLVQIISDGDIDEIQFRRAANEKPGALWHIFHESDVDKIRKFIKSIWRERGEIEAADHDPIHDQQMYLDKELRRRLKEEYGVEGCGIVQCEGDGVFIPAGAPHQVFNLHSCIKIAEDFVSPEHVDKCFNLTNEFRYLSSTHSNHEDKLQIKNIIYHAVKDIVSAAIHRNCQ